jgi:hypothetical protein
LAFVIAASFSSPSPESDTIPEEFTLSVTKFRKRFVHSLPLNICAYIQILLPVSTCLSMCVCQLMDGFHVCRWNPQDTSPQMPSIPSLKSLRRRLVSLLVILNESFAITIAK